MAQDITPWPTDLRLLEAGSRLQVDFETGAQFIIPAELLRVESPSAEVQGHGPDQKILVRDKANVKIADMEAVGRYAVRLIFDDGHETGIFTWPALFEFGQSADQMLAAYSRQRLILTAVTRLIRRFTLESLIPMAICPAGAVLWPIYRP